MNEESQQQMARLEEQFLLAMTHLTDGKEAEAKSLLAQIVSVEPRLPEPHLELAILASEAGDLEEGVAHARLGVELLEQGGQWVDDLSAEVMMSHACNLLGELLVAQAQSEEQELEAESLSDVWNEAVALFARALSLDPENPDARRNSLLHQPMKVDP